MISFFYRPPFIGNYYHRKSGEENVNRLSGRIRGEEIADYLGAKKNPKMIDKTDVCIWVKPVSVNRVIEGGYLDILDTFPIPEDLKERPDIKIIVASQTSYDYLTNLLPNKVILIPSHHVNVERYKRKRTEIKVAGYIGNPSPWADTLYKNVAECLKEFEFKTCFDYKTREDAVDFYRQLDVFVIGDFAPDININKVPTKIINAASFGIPTVAPPLMGYAELEGCYLPVHNMDELVEKVNELKNPVFYKKMSNLVLHMAEPYHIENIAKLYRSL